MYTGLYMFLCYVTLSMIACMISTTVYSFNSEITVVRLQLVHKRRINIKIKML